MVDLGDHLVGIEVARHTDGHVVGCVVALEVVLDVGDGRILQVLTASDGRLCAIGVGGEELRHQGREEFVAVLGETHVVLLIDGLQLRVETANDHVLETVALHLEPVVDLVARDVLHVAGDIVARIGIGAFGSDARHHLVVLVGDVVLGCELRQGVDGVIASLALSGIGERAVVLVACLDGVEVGALGFQVGSAEVVSAFEHQVLQVMGQSRCLGRVVARSCAHGDVRLDAGLLVVDAQIDRQTVFQRVDTGLHRVVGHTLVSVALGRGCRSQR